MGSDAPGQLNAIVSGYYGAGNPGDELILSALLRSLRRTHSLDGVAVLSSNSLETSRTHGVRAIDRPAITYRNAYRLIWGALGSGEIVRATREADVVIVGGGGLLEDVHHFGSIPMHLQVACLGLLLNKPVIGLGLGVGPLLTPMSRHLVKVIGRNMSFLSVRDQESANELLRCGVDRASIRVGADLVFSMREAILRLGTTHRTKRTIGITIGPADWIDLDLKGLAAGVEAAARRMRADEVVVFRMGSSAADERLLRVLSKALTIPHRLESEFKTGEQIVRLVSQLDVLVASKLHALIVAACLGVPAVAISYAPKVSSLANMLDMRVHQADEISSVALDRHIEEAWRLRADGRMPYGERVGSLAEVSDAEVALALSQAASAPMPRGRLAVLFDACQYAVLAPISNLRQIRRSQVGNLAWVQERTAG